ncbi:MAG: ketoacyl-ACP synthase III [Culturomica sp.]|jgi:3-oxoacyl-[acyl-carrier-protein] synthase-3|nr:ketoacyl-ACP synthase III [Culturomica sp.]
MKHIFKNKRISSILTVMPPHEVFFADEMHNYSFPESQNKRLAKVMGFNKRRIGEKYDTVSDYAVYGIQQLIEKGVLKTDEVGAIVVITTTPDHLIPPTSNIIQGRFDFSTETICQDLSFGCAGYIAGVLQAFMLLDVLEDKKVLLVTGDFLSQRIAVRDRGSRPIVGDAVAITILENSKEDNKCYCAIRNDGANCFAVYIPAGGTRLPTSPETGIEEQDIFNNYRAKDHLVMNGDLVFNFIINEVPVMMEELMQDAGITKDDIDYYMCHQSSKFTLQKVADRLDVPRQKVPNNIIETYGNSSSASIPVNMAYNLSEELTQDKQLKIMLAGFGTGLTWGAIIMDMGQMDYCGMVDFAGKHYALGE